jgi:hypothetical protein
MKFAAKQTKLRCCLLIMAFLLLSVSLSNHTYGQNNQDFNRLDSLSYACYLRGDWDCVVQTANKAFEKGYDYYYLRMRMGIALFSQEKYRLAALHFEKALSFSIGDRNALSFLMQSYQYGGLVFEAAALEKQHPDKFTTASNRFLKAVYLSGGYTFSGSGQAVEALDLIGEADVYGALSRSGNYGYLQTGIQFAPFAGSRWFVAYSQLQLNKYDRILISSNDTISYNYTLKQKQFSLSLPIRLSKGLTLFPELDVFAINNEPLLVLFDSISSLYTFTPGNSSFTNYVLGLKLLHETPGFTYGLALGTANFNEKSQFQGSFIFGYYPFRNLNLYTYSRISALAQSNSTQFHFKQIIGFRVANPLWLQAGIHFGHLENAIDDNASLMYNVVGKVDFNSFASLIILLNKNLSFQLDCNLVQRQSPYIQYSDTENFTFITYTYTNLHLKGGLLWKL